VVLEQPDKVTLVVMVMQLAPDTVLAVVVVKVRLDQLLLQIRVVQVEWGLRVA
tara:strand:+ start:566 stop:724 length:159 start_codon:yes stop_codon:yes gene_type:complete